LKSPAYFYSCLVSHDEILPVGSIGPAVRSYHITGLLL
jgi:hypothetical protein